MTAKRELLKILGIMLIIPVILLGWMIVRYGTMTTADLVDGKVGKGIDFDGNDDVVSLGDLSLTTTQTLRQWVASKIGRGRDNVDTGTV